MLTRVQVLGRAARFALADEPPKGAPDGLWVVSLDLVAILEVNGIQLPSLAHLRFEVVLQQVLELTHLAEVF